MEVQVYYRRDERLRYLYRVQRKAAVGEPLGVEGTLLHVQQHAKIRQGRPAHVVDAKQDGPLVWVEEAALVPVDAEEAQGQGQQQDEDGSEDERQTASVQSQVAEVG